MAGVQQVLAERYELLELLGRGGMGVVYRARDRVLDRVVAVKLLPLDRAQDPTAVARFEREALAAAALSHRNIVAVFDFGTDEETRFIVMEYLTGQSLAQLVRARGALAVDQAVDAAAQVASALAAAHEAGIVHRDVKPANVMVNAQGHVKVLDFGIARLMTGASLTQTATVIGSAPYLAPELCRGEPADARSDIYALGCVLYELLTGRPPFTGELPAAIVHQQLSSMPRSPVELNPAVPPALAALCLAVLAKDPGERPQEAGALALSLPAALVRADADAAITTRMPPLDARMPVDASVPLDGPVPVDAPVPEIAAETAATIPLPAAGFAAALGPTRVMPARPPSPRLGPAWPGGGRYLVLIGIIVIALVITLLALASGSGAPGRAVLKRHKSVMQTTTKPLTSTTSSSATAHTTSTASTTQTTPAAVPPGHQRGGPHAGGPHGGGPHGGGPPPGQAKKQGGGNQNQQ